MTTTAHTHIENRPAPNRRYVVGEGEYGGFKIMDLRSTPCVAVASVASTMEERYRIPGEDWKPSQTLAFAERLCWLLNADEEMRLAVNASLVASVESPPAKKSRARRKP